MPLHWPLTLAASTPFFLLWGWLCFNSWRGLLESLLASVQDEDVDEDAATNWSPQLRMLAFIIMSAGTVYFAHLGLRLLGN